ncbi:MauE/DoxX family redox-associated membrane protein [Aureibacter tunicatorum]|uniref:HTH domain antitoxin n=1 Tax=Aureibacter tunicatorum TaxID=866807 RepID=A0AAE3XSR8_9BACT|nr:MauE/DoxX family redox-associated membrane protein [Aureibacter tunicatorum]MDR6241349.1 putative HTH domain antitoxin [Aureibacter tunicatorum]BDD03608.1 hypothetical protein AUTU_10910 [Aureibacter tunicatorum]
MKDSIKSNISNGSDLIMILLYSYTGIIKIFDYNGFIYKLKTSSVIDSDLIYYSAMTTPFLEVIIAVALLFNKTKTLGRISSISLMSLFTFYLIFLKADGQSCSCGGIFEQLSFDQHLYLNVAFIIIAGLPFLFSSNKEDKIIQAQG